MLTFIAGAISIGALVAKAIAMVLDVIAFVVTGQREQGLRRLGELGVEKFVDFMMGVDVAEDHGHQPGRGDAAEQQAEQAAAQREPGGRHLGIV